MEIYKPEKAKVYAYILLLLLLGNGALGILIYFANTYIAQYIFILGMFALSIYCIYYLALVKSLSYELGEEDISISFLFGLKKILIPYKDMESYTIIKGKIDGVKLSGIGNHRFHIGKSFIEKIGISNTFITDSKGIIYIKALDRIYGLSPNNFNEFIKKLEEKGIENKEFYVEYKKNIDMYKEKKFLVPLIMTTIITFFIILNPFILYLSNSLPAKMPLNFNIYFKPTQYGSGKQFAFRQMTYGVFNMVILFCMHYASYFYAKYDKKSAYKYMYIPLIISILFLIIQVRVIFIFA